ncbi:fungal-specific transcription factor domain-containing protein [Mycena olivaceomarginata]|nr:fungal-specific transcription factor domain-containing protein [Mycena olivaceomarginata]
MSSDEDHEGFSVPAKKRRVQRACDMCRRKKSDGLRMSEKKCTNCIENGLACTFAGALAKRRSYVDALEARLELTEQLLRKLSGQNAESSSPSGTNAGSQWSDDSPVTASNKSGPGVMIAALNIRSMNTPAPAPHGSDLAHIALTEDLSTLSINPVRNRFQGKSSGAMLVKQAVQLREGYEEKDVPWSSRRMHYWTYNPVKHRVPHVGPFVFPDPDLLRALVDLYFIHKNLYFPVLHRPTFDRSVAEGLHTRDPTFGAVVLLVCAIGSRFSDDVRVSPPGAEPLRCGWEFFDQLPFHLDHLFETPTIHHLQYYCLATSFLEYSTPAACWTLIGIGIRLAQDVGAHRQREGPPTVESELWKRGFWVLVSYDRQVSMSLGRSCATQYDDIDAELPIECDDDFWENEDPTRAFVQPAGKPSLITFFNCYLRLNNIWRLYALNKTKKLLSYRDQAWEEHLVAEMDSALNGWVDSIPPHLRWDPNRREETFFDQSCPMAIHRPFIPTIREGEPTSLPSLAICTNAARSCSHIAEMSRLRKNGSPVPVLISSVFVSGVILLLNVWSGKRTGLPPHMNSAITEVQKCMATMRVCETKWQMSGLFYDLLHELATIGQVPPCCSSFRVRPFNTNKRAREEDNAAQPDAPAPPAHHPPEADLYHPPFCFGSLPDVHCRPGQAAGVPPAHTASAGKHEQLVPDAGRFPLGRPDFAVGIVPPDADNTANSFPVDPLFASEPDYALGGSNLSNDVMAWATAPTGLSAIDDWGVYLNVMSELNQGFETPVPQS